MSRALVERLARWTPAARGASVAGAVGAGVSGPLGAATVAALTWVADGRPSAGDLLAGLTFGAIVGGSALAAWTALEHRLPSRPGAVALGSGLVTALAVLFACAQGLWAEGAARGGLDGAIASLAGALEDVTSGGPDAPIILAVLLALAVGPGVGLGTVITHRARSERWWDVLVRSEARLLGSAILMLVPGSLVIAVVSEQLPRGRPDAIARHSSGVDA